MRPCSQHTFCVLVLCLLKFQHFDYIQYLGSWELAHMHGRDEYIQSNNVFSSTQSPQLALYYITAGILCKSWMEIGIHSICITLDSLNIAILSFVSTCLADIF